MSSVNIDLLYEAVRSAVLSDLSRDTGLSVACLVRIRNRKTLMPQRRTLERLLPVLKLKLEVIHATT